jgi:hypothetical protein
VAEELSDVRGFNIKGRGEAMACQVVSRRPYLPFASSRFGDLFAINEFGPGGKHESDSSTDGLTLKRAYMSL